MRKTRTSVLGCSRTLKSESPRLLPLGLPNLADEIARRRGMRSRPEMLHLQLSPSARLLGPEAAIAGRPRFSSIDLLRDSRPLIRKLVTLPCFPPHVEIDGSS